MPKPAVTAYERFVDALRDNGNLVKEGSGRAAAQCPAHSDNAPSLSIGPRRDGKGVVVYCQAGCDTADVLSALNMRSADLFDEPKIKDAYNQRRTYKYSDGRIVNRLPNKSFPQDGNKTGRALYHVEIVPLTDGPVYVTEGEKDVEAIEAIGGVAVSPPQGAGKGKDPGRWDWEPLRGRDVIVVTDNDDTGREHAAKVAAALRTIATSVRIVQAAVGKDAADHIAADRGLDEFLDCVLPEPPPPANNGNRNGSTASNGSATVTNLAEWIAEADSPPNPTPTLEELEEDFWDARESLAIIFDAAIARMASPWAVFACCAARMLCLVPPAIVLPDLIGGVGSLNWFAAIVAKSGGGKGAAMRVANDLVPADITVRSIGSGEGMIECYQRGGKEGGPEPRIAVMFNVEEVDSLGAMGMRAGQTTMTILRQGFSGETLGFSYRGRSGEYVAGHTYRMTLVTAVQPDRAGALLDDSGGGTPQRFMWFPGGDRRITMDVPDYPTFANGEPRVLPIISAMDLSRALGSVSIPDEAVYAIRSARVARNSGAEDNALDGHALFAREKLAFFLAFLDGRTDINSEDWRLSGIAANVSEWTRNRAQAGYESGKQQAARDRGAQRGYENDERELTEKAAYDEHVRRLIAWAQRTLTTKGPLTAGELRRRAAKRDRSRIHNAVALALEAGLIGNDEDGKLVALSR